MPGPALLAGFIIAALVVLVTPGPGVVYVVTRSVAQGVRAGLVSAAGLSAGALVHAIAAAAGLSALLLASATAFEIVRALGACYLIWLGARMLLSRESPAGADVGDNRSLSRIFADGVIVSVLNPKIAVFFVAFLPQFVDPTRGPVPQQILFLGLLYCALALLTDGAYAMLAGRARSWLKLRARGHATMRRAAGLVYVGLGVGAALGDRR